MTTANWYFVRNGQPTGPAAAEDVAAMLAQGDLSPRSLVWREGLSCWEKAALHFGPDAIEAPPAVTNSTFRTPAERQRNCTVGADGLYLGAPGRSLLGAAGACLRKYFSFSGRASRSEYWKFTLFCLLAGMVAGIIDAAYFGAGTSALRTGPVGGAFGLFVVLPSLAVTWRRMHDVNRSGWWLIGIYPVIGVCVFITILSGSLLGQQAALGVGVLAAVVMGMYSLRIFLFLTAKGDHGPNRFG